MELVKRGGVTQQPPVLKIFGKNFNKIWREWCEGKSET